MKKKQSKILSQSQESAIADKIAKIINAQKPQVEVFMNDGEIGRSHANVKINNESIDIAILDSISVNSSLNF